MLESLHRTSSTPASGKSHSGKRPRIVLFVEDNGGVWHASRLMAGLQARGLDVVRTTLNACAFDTQSPSGLDIPEFDGALPNGAFVRAVSAGGLEQITFRLGILHALEASGVRVWNPARVIERCVDKATATFLFKRAGLPTPPTRVVEGIEAAARRAAQPGALPLVSKPLFGSQGNGVRLVDIPEALPNPSEVGWVYYLQTYLPPETAGQYEDWRVLVSGGRVVTAMRRQGTGWITNMHQGALPRPHEPDADMTALALSAAAAIDADYAGVDLIRGPDGELLILEINSNPAWKGLQSVTDIDIGDALAEDFAAALGMCPSPTGSPAGAFSENHA